MEQPLDPQRLIGLRQDHVKEQNEEVEGVGILRDAGYEEELVEGCAQAGLAQGGPTRMAYAPSDDALHEARCGEHGHEQPLGEEGRVEIEHGVEPEDEEEGVERQRDGRG